MRSFAARAALCALLFAGAFASVYAGLEGFSLKLSPKVSDLKRYKQVAKLNYMGKDLEFAANSTRTVIKVDPDGSFQVKEEVSEMKINGSEAPAGSLGGPTTATYSSRGALLKLEASHVDEAAVRAANLGIFVMPDKPVAKGDSWEYEVKEDKATGAVAAHAKYTLIGEERIGSIDTLKVKFNIKEDQAAGGSTDGTVWLSKADCTTVKMLSKWLNVPMAGSGGISGELSETMIQ